MTRFLAWVLAACLAFAIPSTALAAEVEPEQAPMDVQLWLGAEPGQLLVVVSTVLPADTEFPATVRLPLVEGMELLWAGQIGDQQQGDVQKQPEIKEGAGGRYAEFQVEDSRFAQVELGSVPLSQTVDGFSANVEFVQTVPVELTSFSVRLPAGASEANIQPAPVGAPDRNQAGESLYTLPSAELSPGDKHSLSVSYHMGETQSAGAGSQSTGVVIGVLLGLLALSIVVLLVILSRQRARRGETEEPGVPDDEDES